MPEAITTSGSDLTRGQRHTRTPTRATAIAAPSIIQYPSYTLNSGIEESCAAFAAHRKAASASNAGISRLILRRFTG
jgi:hypothetical protein